MKSTTLHWGIRVGFCAFLLLFVTSTFAQNSALTTKVDPEFVPHKMHWIGIHSGMTSGLGVTYRVFPERIGVQFSTLPIYAAGELRMSAGAMAMYAIRSREHFQLIAYGSGSMNNYFDSQDEFRVSVGAGLGFEVFPAEELNFSLLLGYGGLNILSDDLYVVPTIGFGAYYRLFP